MGHHQRGHKTVFFSNTYYCLSCFLFLIWQKSISREQWLGHCRQIVNILINSTAPLKPEDILISKAFLNLYCIIKKWYHSKSPLIWPPLYFPHPSLGLLSSQTEFKSRSWKSPSYAHQLLLCLIRSLVLILQTLGAGQIQLQKHTGRHSSCILDSWLKPWGLCWQYAKFFLSSSFL